MSEQISRLKFKKFRLENIEQCWDYIHNEGLESFIYNFSNETLSKVYRLIIFSSELPNVNTFYHNVQVNIEDEAQKRKFDCFSPHVKDNKS